MNQTHSSLRIVYMGTPDFAVEPLKQLLLQNIQVVGVVTMPDKQAGRGQKMQKSAVKIFAEEHNLPIAQPERLRSEDFIAQLKEWNADLFVVVAFRMLPEIVWSMPAKGTINLHASLLPQYRGAAPINWALINGETLTGTTTFFISHDIDTGNILLQKPVSIEKNDTAGELHDKLMYSGAQLLVETVKQIESGTCEAKPQVHSNNLKHAPKIFKETCKIDWNQPSIKINNLIKGLSPYPTAFTLLALPNNTDELICKIYLSQSEEVNHQHTIGSLHTDNKTYCKIACIDGYIYINELQLAGKKRMSIQQFLLGFRNISSYTAL